MLGGSSTRTSIYRMSKARSEFTVIRSLIVFLAVGPFVGWFAMFLQALLLMGDVTDDGLVALLALLVIGIPYAYGFGSAAALLGGLAYGALRRRYKFRVALIVVTVAGMFFGPLGAIVLWSATPFVSDDIFARWQEYMLPGACAACVCACLSDSRVFRTKVAVA
jgi:hypothetical protein